MKIQAIAQWLKEAIISEPQDHTVKSSAVPFLIFAPPETVAPLLGNCVSSTWDPFVHIHQLLEKEGHDLSKLARQSDDGQADSWLPPSHWPERSSKVVCSMFFQLSRDGKEGLCIARCFHQLKRRPMADGIDATEYEVTVELHATERGWDEYLRPDVAQQSALKLGEQLREAAERRARHEQRSLPSIVVHSAG